MKSSASETAHEERSALADFTMVKMKREIVITALLAIIVVALILGMKFTKGSVDAGSAEKFVLEDLRTKFQDADKIKIVKSEQKANEKGESYYAIKVALSDGLDGPCPNRTNYYYNYPVQNFVPAPPEYAVIGCMVCQTSPCLIAFEEEAVIASHTLPGTGDVHSYILLSGDAKSMVSKIPEGWKVMWTSSLNYSYSVDVSNDGKITGVEVR